MRYKAGDSGCSRATPSARYVITQKLNSVVTFHGVATLQTVVAHLVVFGNVVVENVIVDCITIAKIVVYCIVVSNLVIHLVVVSDVIVHLVVVRNVIVHLVVVSYAVFHVAFHVITHVVVMHVFFFLDFAVVVDIFAILEATFVFKILVAAFFEVFVFVKAFVIFNKPVIRFIVGLNIGLAIGFDVVAANFAAAFTVESRSRGGRALRPRDFVC